MKRGLPRFSVVRGFHGILLDKGQDSFFSCLAYTDVSCSTKRLKCRHSGYVNKHVIPFLRATKFKFDKKRKKCNLIFVDSGNLNTKRQFSEKERLRKSMKIKLRFTHTPVKVQPP